MPHYKFSLIGSEKYSDCPKLPEQTNECSILYDLDESNSDIKYVDGIEHFNIPSYKPRDYDWFIQTLKESSQSEMWIQIAEWARDKEVYWFIGD